MAILNFPDTAGRPTDGTFTYEFEGIIYIWDGEKWTSQGSSGSGGGGSGVTPGNGILTIKDSAGTDLGVFTANQSTGTNTEITLPASGSGTLQTSGTLPLENPTLFTRADSSGLTHQSNYNQYIHEYVEEVEQSIPTDNSELANGSGYITDAGVTKIIAGTNVSIDNDGTGEVRISSTGSSSGGGGSGFSGDYNDLTNKPDIPDATSDLSNDSGFITISDVPAGFSGSYNDLSDKPTIPTNNNQLTNGQNYITAAEAPVQPGDLFSGDYNDLTNQPSIPASPTGSNPITVNGSNQIGLSYNRGLTLVSNKLEADLGDGLAFNNNKIQVQFPTNSVINFKPQAKNIPTSEGKSYQFTSKATDFTLPDTYTLSFDVPPECDGFVTITTFRHRFGPDPAQDYTVSPSVQRLESSNTCTVTGRNASCQTSNDSDQIALAMGNILTWGGGPASPDTELQINSQYSVRVDEWTCDKGNGQINFKFGVKVNSCNRITIKYLVGCRIAIFPFDSSTYS